MSKKVSSKYQLARLLNISQPTVAALLNVDGCPQQVEGYYDVDMVAQWAMQSPDVSHQLKQKCADYLGIDLELDPLMSDKTSDGDSPAQERYRLARAKREELKLAQELKELVKLSDYLEDERKRYSIVKQQLLTLPVVLPIRLETLSAKEIAEELDLAVNNLLIKLKRDLADGI